MTWLILAIIMGLHHTFFRYDGTGKVFNRYIFVASMALTLFIFLTLVIAQIQNYNGESEGNPFFGMPESVWELFDRAFRAVEMATPSSIAFLLSCYWYFRRDVLSNLCLRYHIVCVILMGIIAELAMRHLEATKFFQDDHLEGLGRVVTQNMFRADLLIYLFWFWYLTCINLDYFTVQRDESDDDTKENLCSGGGSDTDRDNGSKRFIEVNNRMDVIFCWFAPLVLLHDLSLCFSILREFGVPRETYNSDSLGLAILWKAIQLSAFLGPYFIEFCRYREARRADVSKHYRQGPLTVIPIHTGYDLLLKFSGALVVVSFGFFQVFTNHK